MSDMHQGKSDIGETYVVTERSYDVILHYLNMTRQMISDLPYGAVVVEVGSGRYQEFAKGINGNPANRSDITVISIDPSLGLDPLRPDVALTRRPGEIRYSVQDPRTIDPKANKLFQDEQWKRTYGAHVGARAARAPGMGLEPGSADLIVDSHGPVLYLHEEFFDRYIREIACALKPGGQARLYPISWLSHRAVESQSDQKNCRAKLDAYFTRLPGLRCTTFFVNNLPGILLEKES